ncbi:MAG TPA: right-handed parallel beta-helix repeat-containing protein [Kofleriaceae bacterium]|nr:right-handed parallel beta-helix repeat-containing protein [Kofleriaceae bacterium]
MQGKHWLIIVAMLVWGACDWKVPNSHRCPDGEDCPPVGGPCEGDNECRAPTPVCNEVANVCVECMENTDCAASRPICSSQNECVQCQSDDDCESKLCLDGGGCAAPNEVTYIGGANAMDNPTCTRDNPCENLEQGLKAMALRRYIKLTGPITESAERTINKTVTIYGRSGAQIARTGNGEVLLLKGMTSPIIHLIGLEIVGNPGSGGKDCVELSEKAEVTMTRVRVRNHGQAGIALVGTAKLVMIDSHVHNHELEGINAGAGTTLELYRSLIYSNANGTTAVAGVNATSAAMVKIDSSTITTNPGTAGGVSITGPFSIKNSIIAVNGSVAKTTVAGGLNLNPVQATNLAEFEFNTVADNSSPSGAGLICVAVPVKVSNSIITVNTAIGCDILHSLTGLTGTPEGTNKVGDPMFVTKALLDPMFYRIGAMSTARDSADPAATLDVDIDGQKRDDARKDMGADEYK